MDDYTRVREMLVKLGFVLECGENAATFCFATGKPGGWVYLFFYDRRLIECIYYSPYDNCGLRGSKKEPLRFRIVKAKNGKCGIAFEKEGKRLLVRGLADVETDDSEEGK
jgi:hypothetical protein